MLVVEDSQRAPLICWDNEKKAEPVHPDEEECVYSSPTYNYGYPGLHEY